MTIGTMPRPCGSIVALDLTYVLITGVSHFAFVPHQLVKLNRRIDDLCASEHPVRYVVLKRNGFKLGKPLAIRQVPVNHILRLFIALCNLLDQLADLVGARIAGYSPARLRPATGRAARGVLPAAQTDPAAAAHPSQPCRGRSDHCGADSAKRCFSGSISDFGHVKTAWCRATPPSPGPWYALSAARQPPAADCW